MKCHDVKQLIFLHLDGEATQKQQAYLFDHIKECANCRNEMATAKCTHDMLIEHCTLEADVPNGFRDSIMSKINAEPLAPHVPLQKTRLRKKQHLISKQWGIGLVAGIIGLFFAYNAMSGDVLGKLAQFGNTNPEVNSPQLQTPIIEPKVNNKVAELPVTPDKPEKDNKIENKAPSTTVPEVQKNDGKPVTHKEKPVQVPPKVAGEIELPSKGSVDLPKPASVLSLIYNQADNSSNLTNDAPKEVFANKPLILSGEMVALNHVANKLQILTISNQLAKLWSFDPSSNQAREIDAASVNGIPFSQGGKVQSVDAKQVAVSSKGQLATLTTENDKLILTAGDNSTALSGKITSKLTWSPDGSKVLYLLVKDNLGHLESFDGERKQLTPDMPVKDITWTFLGNDKLLLNLTADAPGIWELDLKETNFTPLANYGGGNAIQANANGDIAFTDASGKLYVLLKNANQGSKLIEMTSQGSAIKNIIWLDTKTLLYFVSQQGQTQIFKARLP